jgi:polysaccharide export outer membrane protein
MFKTPKNSISETDTLKSKYYTLVEKSEVPLLPQEDYKISKDDKIIFLLSTNGGQDIISGQAGVSSSSINTVQTQRQFNQIEYVVRSDGKVLLPLIGEISIEGMTVKKSEDTLKQLFSTHFLDPFVQVTITNKRVIVFPGDGGAARVIYIKNNNTTLMEVIAEVGGISERGKSKSIKLMRSINGKREIYPIDLSTIEGLAFADMIVQANDYVYVEPHPKLGREVLTQVAPIVSILTSALVLFNVFMNIK